MNYEELLWNSSIEELKNGYIFDQKREEYVCIMCGREFKKGKIFESNDGFFDAEFAMKNHIMEKHSSPFQFLLNMEKRHNGLSDVQKNVADGMYGNLPDNEIALRLGSKSGSTIRSHKYSLREKYKEAKIFIALMDIINERNADNSKFINFHKDLPVNDDRIIVTEEEKEAFVRKYFESDGIKLKRFPKKQKEKLVVLREIIKNFVRDKKYTEKEVNEVLKKTDSDYVTIRRYLIDYGFMARKSDCSEYWVR